MFRRASLLPALGAVAASTALVATAVPPAADAAPARVRDAAVVGTLPSGPARPAAHRVVRRAADASPLSVTIDTMTPSYIPRKGPIRVTGSVTNHDDATWRQVQTYAFISATPLRSAAELVQASATDPASDVGGRITAPGDYDTLPRIAPGKTVQYSIRVPRADLAVSEAGVYWFGVHALGEGPDGRTGGADGRARTFLPLVDRSRRAVDTAVVVPLRHALPRTPDGRLAAERGWGRRLAPTGPLGTLVDFGTSAGSRPLTWLVDPALPDAVESLAAGNPPRSLASPARRRSGTRPDDDTSATPGPAPSPSPSDADAGTGTDATSAAGTGTATAQAATAWLKRLQEGLRDSQVLALPYGDVDVPAAAAHGRGLFRKARARTGTTLEPVDLPAEHGIGSPSGFLDRAALRLTRPGDTVLVTDEMLPPDSPTRVRAAGRRVVALSSGAASGGPGPQDRLTAVGLRQRILAEAAVRLLRPGPQQLAVMIPQDWAPTSTTGFFEGLDVGWLHLTTVDGLRGGGRVPRVPADQLAYPRSEARRELDGASFAAARALIRAGRTLEDVLHGPSDVARQLTDQALTSVSYGARRHPHRARSATRLATRYVRRQLGSITIEAPRAVTLSSASGRFAATVTNRLDQPVEVSISAVSDAPLSIRAPGTLQVGAGGSSTVLLTATTRRPGIHNVTLRLTDSDGTLLGATDTLPVRSAEVSNVIWLILGTGVVLLFGAIAVRLFRRLRAAARAARPS